MSTCGLCRAMARLCDDSCSLLRQKEKRRLLRQLKSASRGCSIIQCPAIFTFWTTTFIAQRVTKLAHRAMHPAKYSQISARTDVYYLTACSTHSSGILWSAIRRTPRKPLEMDGLGRGMQSAQPSSPLPNATLSAISPS